MSQTARKCLPTCEFFRCGQRALYLHTGKAFCRWADDECAGATCSYVSCVRGRLLANGICGMSIKRKTVEERGPEEVEVPKVKLKGKVLQKLGDEEVI